MKILMILTILLDLVAILLVSIEDVYLDGFDKFKYIVLILLLPIIGALIVFIHFGGKGKPNNSSDGSNSNDYPPSYSSGGSSGGGGD